MAAPQAWVVTGLVPHARSEMVAAFLSRLRLVRLSATISRSPGVRTLMAAKCPGICGIKCPEVCGTIPDARTT